MTKQLPEAVRDRAKQWAKENTDINMSTVSDIYSAQLSALDREAIPLAIALNHLLLEEFEDTLSWRGNRAVEKAYEALKKFKGDIVMTKCNTTHHACDCMLERMERVEKENAELRKALEFYSDHETYCLYEDLSTKDWDGNFIAERSPNKLTQVGRLARTVLKKIQDD